MLLERDTELSLLADRVGDARDSRGSIVLIAGEAGIGKTSLVRTFSESLGPDVIVVRGQCDPLSTPRALGPVRDMISDPDLGLMDLDPSGEPSELFSAIADRLSTSIRPIVMVVEDVHWADGGTLDFLQFVGRRIETMRSVLICTYRDDEVGPGHPLRPVLGRLVPLPPVHRLRLANLSLGSIAVLAEGSGIDPDDLLSVTGGNAFFATEAIAAGTLNPSSAQDAVIARVSSMSEAARRVVNSVSISSRPISIPRATQLAGVTHEPIDEALDSGVLVASGPRIGFRHEIARVAVETSLQAGSRVAMNEAMIRLLVEDDPIDPARIAHHAIAAGDGHRIAEYAPLAGHEARAAGAGREAVAFYQAALNHRDALDTRSQADIEFELGWLLLFQLDHVGGRQALEHAIALYEDLGDVDQVVRSMVRLQQAVWELDGHQAANLLTERALALARTTGSPAAEAAVLYRIAHNNMIDRRRDEALEAASHAEAVASSGSEDDAAWRAGLMVACVHLVMGDPDVGLDLADEKVREAEQMQRPDLVSAALGMIGSGSGEARKYERAEAALRAGIELDAKAGYDHTLAYNLAWSARVRFERGDWESAGRLADEALAVDGSNGIAATTARCVLGRLAVRRGDVQGSRVLESVLLDAEEHLLQYVWNAYCGLAEEAWLRGRDASSLNPSRRAAIARAHDRAMQTDSPWARGEVGFWMSRLGLIDDPPEGAAEPFRLQMEGRWAEAARRWEAIGCPYEVAVALLDGDAEAVSRAVDIFDDLGAAPAARLARNRLKELGVTKGVRGPNRSTASNPVGLTDRQLDVLGHMARGMSNAEIADALFVSKKTVEHHASAVYAKLGVNSRTKAITSARELGILD